MTQSNYQTLSNHQTLSNNQTLSINQHYQTIKHYQKGNYTFTNLVQLLAQNVASFTKKYNPG